MYLHIHTQLGIHKEQWYHYAKNFSLISLPLYGINVNRDAYEKAMEAVKTCTLEDLSYMNDIVGGEKGVQ